MTDRPPPRQSPARDFPKLGMLPPLQPTVPPIHHAVTYAMDDVVRADLASGGRESYWYSRYRNPTTDQAAEVIGRWEGGEAAVMTASGMAAISSTLLALCSRGDRLVAPRQIYGDTKDLLTLDLERLGVEVVFVDGFALDQWAMALAQAPTTVVFTETLSNPSLRITDLRALTDLAHRHGAQVVVDSTFASPALCRPLEHGVDVVVHSVTKFLNGHSDVTAGAVVGSAEFIERLRAQLIRSGACLDAHAAYLVWRGLRTFDVRMERSMANARRLASRLARRDDVVEVLHPSLSNFPDSDLAKDLFDSDDCAIVTFIVAGGDDRASAMMRNLCLAFEATSLGGIETLVSAPATSSHLNLDQSELQAAGIMPGMVRVSCGLDNTTALLADFDNALDATRDLLCGPTTK